MEDEQRVREIAMGLKSGVAALLRLTAEEGSPRYSLSEGVHRIMRDAEAAGLGSTFIRGDGGDGVLAFSISPLGRLVAAHIEPPQ